ncbi:MAG: nuoG, partial [Rhizobacter sp.]|nr:nuoG [Rhizobacter sp.]
DGDSVKVTQGQGWAVLPARLESALPESTVRVAAGHPATATLGDMFGPLQVEKA